MSSVVGELARERVESKMEGRKVGETSVESKTEGGKGRKD